MRKLLCATALASISVATAANAASWTFGNLVITQISAENPSAFNDDSAGTQTGNSTVCDFAYCGAIQFTTDSSVVQGTSGSAAAPAGDATNYLYGVNGINPWGYNGAEVLFNPALGSPYPNSFNIFWGSIDALTTSTGSTRYDNTLSVYVLGGSGPDTVTGSQLVAAGVFGVDGLGSQSSAGDNQWFNIWDTAGPIVFFTASSTQNSFEFDMGSAVPEPATWAMLVIGFAGLGYAATRRRAKGKMAIA